MAIRMSLGAGRWRLVRQLLTESTLLALAGAVVGLLLAAVSDGPARDACRAVHDARAGNLAERHRPALHRWRSPVRPAMLVGAIPALPGRVSLSSAIQEGGRTVSAGRGSLRSALIVAQVAVSFVLLIGAGLMLRSVMRLQSVDAGIRTDSVLSMRVALNFSKYTDAGAPGAVPDRAGRSAARICRASARPAAPARFPMNDGGGFLAGVRVEGQPEVEAARLPRAEVQSATPGLLPDRRHSAAARTAHRRPRHRRSRARGGHQRFDGAAVLSATPMPSARGSRPTTAAAGLRIVGVVGDVRSTLACAAVADALSAARAGAAPDGHVPGADVRRSGGARAADARRRARDRSAAAGRSVPDARRGALGVARGATPDGDAHRRLRRRSRSLITAAGLAGVIAFSVNQRSQEFGVRMALGASRALGAAAGPRPGTAPRAARPRARRRRRHRAVQHRPHAAVRHAADRHPDVRWRRASCWRSWRSWPACCPPAGRRHRSIRWSRWRGSEADAVTPDAVSRSLHSLSARGSSQPTRFAAIVSVDASLPRLGPQSSVPSVNCGFALRERDPSPIRAIVL